VPHQPPTPYAESLSGLIERVTFFNEDNGYGVLKVKAKGRGLAVVSWAGERDCPAPDPFSVLKRSRRFCSTATLGRSSIRQSKAAMPKQVTSLNHRA
jgi:hypothetical protein